MQLTIYEGGSAILTDDDGESLWVSDADDVFLEEFGEIIDIDDANAVLEFLDAAGYIEEGEEIEVIDAAVDELADDDEDVDEDDDDDEDEDEDDEPELYE